MGLTSSRAVNKEKSPNRRTEDAIQSLAQKQCSCFVLPSNSFQGWRSPNVANVALCLKLPSPIHMTETHILNNIRSRVLGLALLAKAAHAGGY